MKPTFAPFLIWVLFFMGGCASVPEVASAGKDTYIVSRSGGIYTQDSGPIRADVFRAANDYCAQRSLSDDSHRG